MSYFQLVQRITVAKLLACPSCQSLVSDKRTSAISNAATHTVSLRGGGGYQALARVHLTREAARCEGGGGGAGGAGGDTRGEGKA